MSPLSSVCTMTTFLSLMPCATTSKLHVVCHANTSPAPSVTVLACAWMSCPKHFLPDTQWSAEDVAVDSSSLVTTPPPRFVNENDPQVFPSGAVAIVTGWSCGANACEQSGQGSYVRRLDDRAGVRVRVVVSGCRSPSP